MSTEPQYEIRMNRQQVAVVRQALEMYSRLLAGQIDTVMHDAFIDRYGSETWNYDSQKRICGELKAAVFPELRANAFYGVGSRVYPQHNTAWDIMQVLRHRLAWDRHAEEGGQGDTNVVCFDRPICFGEEPLPTIRKVAKEGEDNGRVS
ncbi:MAG: hypothetical protein E6Q97_09720 [Desulfurellales bacterium]|nr:MAG: hypothetical protein E6Q97_09720 [Desulfurellales bacterium]